eukprot:5405903-Amphidinium_carterae.1
MDGAGQLHQAQACVNVVLWHEGQHLDCSCTMPLQRTQSHSGRPAFCRVLQLLPNLAAELRLIRA